MFKLSRKKVILRTSIIGVLVLSILSIAGLFLMNRGEVKVDAASSDGSTVWLGVGGSVHYSNYSTSYFSITSGGQTYRGYCANPTLSTPGEDYYRANLATGHKYDLMKLIMYIGQYNNSFTSAARAEIFDYWGADSEERYAYTHAIIGGVNGDYTGLSDGDRDYVIRMIDKLNGYIDNDTDVWAVAKTYNLFYTEGGSGYQDVVWIEGPNIIHGNIKVQKCDIETGKCNSDGKRNLSGITFSVYNNSGKKVYNEITGRVYANGALVTSGTTDASGVVNFSNLAGGTYLVKETATNAVYALNTNGQTTTISTDNETKNLTFKDRLKRGDVKFLKKDATNDQIMPNTLFSISSLDENSQPTETHIVVSNSEGIVNTASSFALHSNHTNGYDEPYDLDKPITFQGYGTWFGVDGDGGQIAVDDNAGALPLGTYLIQELRCASNIFCYEVKDEKVTVEITTDGQVLDLGDWDNTCAELKLETTATDKADGDHYIEAGKATIVDHVEYCVREGLDYTIKGVLMDKSTGKPLEINGKTFEKTAAISPEDPCGTLDMEFTVDASKLAGKDVVVFEYLYYKEGVAKSHEDLEDEGQTVSIVKLRTYATNDATGEKTLPLNQDVKVKDVVSYCLKPGVEYTIKGILMNKNTKEPVLYNGEPVTAETTITPEESCGKLDMFYTLNTADLAGVELVIFESLYLEDQLILEHNDFENASETVIVEVPVPETGALTKKDTSATEAISETFIVGAAVFVGLGGYISMRVVARRTFRRKIDF